MSAFSTLPIAAQYALTKRLLKSASAALPSQKRRPRSKHAESATHVRRALARLSPTCTDRSKHAKQPKTNPRHPNTCPRYKRKHGRPSPHIHTLTLADAPNIRLVTCPPTQPVAQTRAWRRASAPVARVSAGLSPGCHCCSHTAATFA